MSSDDNNIYKTKVSSPQRINARSITGPQTSARTRLEGDSVDMSRADLGDALGGSYGAKRDLSEALGYPNNDALGYYTLLAKYLRDPIARTLVDKPAEDTWQDPPEVTEPDTTADDPTTDFEKAVKKLIQGDTLRRSLQHRWRVAHILARLGEYSVMFFAFADGGEKDPSQKAADGTFSGDGKEDGSLGKLWHVQVFSEPRVDPTLEKSLTKRRYGMPKKYILNPSDDESDEVTAHHTRTVHVVQGARANDMRSESVLFPVFNRLEDLARLFGGSSEMYWQGAYPGIVVNPPKVEMPTGEEQYAEFADDGEGIHDQIKQYRQTLERAIFPNGGEVKTLQPNIESPKEHVAVQLQAIAAGAQPSIPQSMLVGNESGERATTEDRKTYHEAIRSVRHNFAEPVLVRPVIDRLIEVGVLPEPDAGRHEYEVNWQPLEQPTAQEEANVRKTEAVAAEKTANVMALNPQFGKQLLRRLDYTVEELDQVGVRARQGRDSDPADAIDVDDTEHTETIDNTGGEPGPDRNLRQNAVDFDDNDDAQEAWEFIQSSSVNMTASQVEDFKESTCGENYHDSSDGNPKKAANRAITVLEKSQDEWTSDTVSKALKMKSYHARHKEQTDSDQTVPGDCELSPNAAGLMMWAHDPVGRYS